MLITTVGTVIRPDNTYRASRTPATPIGLILSDDRYSCHSNICAGLTFSRIADLKRHHNTVHSTSPTRFWCAWKGCSRSDGGKPFPRKDKRDEHVRKKHLKTTNIRRHLWRLLLNWAWCVGVWDRHSFSVSFYSRRKDFEGFTCYEKMYPGPRYILGF